MRDSRDHLHKDRLGTRGVESYLYAMTELDFRLRDLTSANCGAIEQLKVRDQWNEREDGMID